MLKVSLKMVPGPSQLTRLLHAVLRVQLKPLLLLVFIIKELQTRVQPHAISAF